MELQEKIIEEATHQYFQYGIRNVTMDGIATGLGMSKRTVYEIFKDKNELVHECLKSIKQKHNAKNQEIVTTSTNVIETIFSFMQEGIKSMNAINPVFFRDMEKFYNSTWKKLKEENEKEGFMLTTELLKKGIKEGLFREDINIQIVSKLFHEQINLLANEEIFPRDEFNYTDVFQNLTINFMRGISTQKGIDLIDKILE
ncbi:transcriptional regulator, TetR family [Tangfeifania diversioriginum]|uniref:Transcriptional regulator, TetR family n=1 Tax=Tangfeifania diversioriginum TaxID=1168035 RepID=A0A1M6A822_9BACT|nr:TetR/AcrR family transcriptional regulator [Tangfeifania diversioriginum]SHI32610.1 transcriptional regulator, TetR family [Tangfeifania diversioriginum]